LGHGELRCVPGEISIHEHGGEISTSDERHGLISVGQFKVGQKRFLFAASFELSGELGHGQLGCLPGNFTLHEHGVQVHMRIERHGVLFHSVGQVKDGHHRFLCATGFELSGELGHGENGRLPGDSALHHHGRHIHVSIERHGVLLKTVGQVNDGQESVLSAASFDLSGEFGHGELR